MNDFGTLGLTLFFSFLGLILIIYFISEALETWEKKSIEFRSKVTLKTTTALLIAQWLFIIYCVGKVIGCDFLDECEVEAESDSYGGFITLVFFGALWFAYKLNQRSGEELYQLQGNKQPDVRVRNPGRGD